MIKEQITQIAYVIMVLMVVVSHRGWIYARRNPCRIQKQLLAQCKQEREAALALLQSELSHCQRNLQEANVNLQTCKKNEIALEKVQSGLSLCQRNLQEVNILHLQTCKKNENAFENLQSGLSRCQRNLEDVNMDLQTCKESGVAQYIAEAAGSFRALFKEAPMKWLSFISIPILIITIIFFLRRVTGVQVPRNVNMGRIAEGRIDDIAARQNQQDQNVQNKFERIVQMVAALDERNERQEQEVRQLREFLMQPGGNAILADGHQQRTIVGIESSAGENEMAGRSACSDAESNFEIIEERQLRRRPTQETKQPKENIGSTSII